jgi:hypothetical protein
MAKFNLYDKPMAAPILPPPPPAALPSALQFVGGVSLWFLVVFFVGYLLLAL